MVAEELGYHDDYASVRQRFGSRLEGLTFEQLVRYAKYRRELLNEKSFSTTDRSECEKAILAVQATLRVFEEIEYDAKLRSRLIMGATARSSKTRNPELSALLNYVLTQSTPWKQSTYMMLAAMLLHRLDPKCRIPFPPF